MSVFRYCGHLRVSNVRVAPVFTDSLFGGTGCFAYVDLPAFAAPNGEAEKIRAFAASVIQHAKPPEQKLKKY